MLRFNCGLVFFPSDDLPGASYEGRIVGVTRYGIHIGGCTKDELILEEWFAIHHINGRSEFH